MLNNNEKLIGKMINDGIISSCALDNARVSTLVFAIKHCYDDIVRRLIYIDAAVNQFSGSDQRNPLQVAAENGKLPVMRYLMETQGDRGVPAIAAHGRREAVETAGTRNR